MTRDEHASRKGRESLSKRLGSLAKRIRERDGNKCIYCGATEGPMHFDHAVPRSSGGKDVANNLMLACASCNSRRQDKLLPIFMSYLKDNLGWTPSETRACMIRIVRHLSRSTHW